MNKKPKKCECCKEKKEESELDEVRCNLECWHWVCNKCYEKMIEENK